MECNDGLPLLYLNEEYFENSYISTHPTFMTNIKQKKVSETFLAVENFRFPFKITNMLAIVSKKNLIVFDSSPNSQIGNELLEKFQKGAYKNLNYIGIDFSNIDTTNFETNKVDGRDLNSIIFVSDNNVISGNNEIMDILKSTTGSYKRVEKIGLEIGNNEIKYIWIDTDNTEQDSTFSINSNSNDDSLAIETMAVFSNSPTFNCSYNLLFNTIVSSYEFYELKAQSYATEGTHFCTSTKALQSSLYSDLKDTLSSVRTTFENTGLNLNEDLTPIKVHKLD